MSKKKPNKVFRLLTVDDQPIYVIARHGKGARTIAIAEGLKLSRRDAAAVEVDPRLADNAIKAKEQSI